VCAVAIERDGEGALLMTFVFCAMTAQPLSRFGLIAMALDRDPYWDSCHAACRDVGTGEGVATVGVGPVGVPVSDRRSVGPTAVV